MKKFFFFPLFLLCFIALFSLKSSETYAGDSPNNVDQSYAPTWCTNRGGCYEQIINNNGLGQTFIPTQNRLVFINVFFRDKVEGSSVRLQIVRFSTSELIGERINIMSAGEGWSYFWFDNIEIEPGAKYVIKLTTPDTQTKWVWYNNPDYENGSRLDPKPGDYIFQTVGYIYTPDPDEGTEPPTVPDTTPATVPEGNDGTDGGEVTDQEEENQTGEEPPEETNGEIQAPELLYVINGSEVYNSPISETLAVEEDEILKIAGTAVPSSRVVISIGSAIFSTEVNAQGEWTITIYMTNIEDGEHDVVGQTQIDDTRESSGVTLFKILKGQPTPSQEQATTSKKTQSNLTTIIIITLSVVTVLLILSVYILWRKLRNKKKKIKDGKSEETKPMQKDTA